MNPFTAAIQCGIFRAVLDPDSRGYVLFHLEIQDGLDVNLFHPLTSQDVLTCEHLPDLHNVTLGAMVWISQYCKDICDEEGKHLYFKFKEPTDERTVSGEPRGSDASLIAARPRFTERLSSALRALGFRR